ncbi:MAG TPA: hypothetical protein VGL91_08330 [Acidobacteriota bacterium]
MGQFSLRKLTKVALLILWAVAFFGGCAGPAEAKIEAVGGTQAALPFHMQSLSGVRDGDLLRTRLVFSGDSSPLVMDMDFRIGVPTRLESGHYRWQRKGESLEGKISALSVTFLGGQADRPSVGGVFELSSPQGVPVYKVTLPTHIVSRNAQNR